MNAGFFDGNVAITGQLLVRGVPIGPELAQQITNFQQQIASLQQQLSTLHQLVNNIQQQLSSLQQKEAVDVQGISASLVTLAARITALGG